MFICDGLQTTFVRLLSSNPLTLFLTSVNETCLANHYCNAVLFNYEIYTQIRWKEWEEQQVNVINNFGSNVLQPFCIYAGIHILEYKFYKMDYKSWFLWFLIFTLIHSFVHSTNSYMHTCNSSYKLLRFFSNFAQLYST